MWIIIGYLIFLTTVYSIDSLKPIYYDGSLSDRQEDRSNDILLVFHRPTPGILVPVTLFSVFGENREYISISIENNSIIARAKLSANDTDMMTKLLLQDNNMEVIVDYKRVLRTITLRVGISDKVTERYTGRSFKFIATSYRVLYHPLVCISDLLFNRASILPQISYPDCMPTVKLIKSARPNQVDVYSGEMIPLFDMLPLQFSGCELELMVEPGLGTVIGPKSDIIIYQRIPNNLSPHEEYLWVFSSCQGNTAQLFYVVVHQAELTCDCDKIIKVNSLTTLIDESYFNITRTVSAYSLPPEISYTVFSQGQFGSLLVSNSSIGTVSFGINNIKANQIVYRLSKSYDSPFIDTVKLFVSSPGAISKTLSLDFVYNPDFEIHVYDIRVKEGKKVILNKNQIKVGFGLSTNFTYLIISAPQHGKILRSSTMEISEFGNDDLEHGLVVYSHDNSESTTDIITLKCVLNNDPAKEVNITVKIWIDLVNDNKPRRISSDVITVLENMATTLTVADLQYVDDDIDSQTLTIQRQGIACGDIRNKLLKTSTFIFSQLDVNNHSLLFSHFGDLDCRLVLWVSDGEHTVPDVISIKAVEHHVSISGSKIVQIQPRGSSVIDQKVIFIESNSKAEDIMIKQGVKPKHGRITPTEVPYRDFIDGKLIYDQMGMLSMYDAFSLDILIGDILFREKISVVINTNPLLLQPQVLKNFPVVGRLGSVVVVNEDYLYAYHALATPKDIIYQVPSATVFQATGSFIDTFNANKPIAVFTQDDISKGRLGYRLGNSPDRITILIAFNGVSTDVVFRSYPFKKYITTEASSSLLVWESSSVVLTRDVIMPSDIYLKLLSYEIKILETPKHGLLLVSSQNTTSFSTELLSSNAVSYVHDGSKSRYDYFTLELMHIPSGLTSEPTKVEVSIQPVKKHPPSFNSSGELLPITLWEGELTLLSGAHLLVSGGDSNTLSSDLIYEWMNPNVCGSIMKMRQAVTQFTQQDVDEKLIYYDLTEDGCKKKLLYLDFNVTDGAYFTKVNITVKIGIRQQVQVAVFPVRKPHVFLEHLPLYLRGNTYYRIDTAPVYGFISRTDVLSSPESVTEFYSNTSMAYIPDLSSASMEKLCKNVSQSLQDVMILSAYSSQLRNPNQKTRVLFDISFLNIKPSNKAMDAQEKVQISVSKNIEYDLTITADQLSITDLLSAVSACHSDIQLGFSYWSQHGLVKGGDRDGIIWWSNSSSIDVKFIPENLSALFYSFTLTPILKQKKAKHAIPNTAFNIVLRIKNQELQPPVTTWQYSLLQGYKNVVLYPKLELKSSDITYDIIEHPKHGILIDGDGQKLNSISFDHMLKGKVIYTQLNMVSSDTFLIKNADLIEVVIIVTPNIIPKAPLVVSTTQPTRITTNSLDASPLLESKFKADEIIYTVIKSFTHGVLKVSQRGKRTIANLQFSHADILNGEVLYHPPELLNHSVEDVATYTLYAPGIQPANGHIIIVLNGTSHATKTELLYTEYSIDGRILTMIAVIISVAVAFIVLVFTVICLRKYRSSNSQAKSAVKCNEPRLILAKENGSYKLLIAGCDDFVITPHSLPPSPTRIIDVSRTPEVSSTVPEVQVTPLVAADGTPYDFHDYVNYDDLFDCQNNGSERTGAGTGNGANTDTFLFHDSSYFDGSSDEYLPPIKPPNYSR